VTHKFSLAGGLVGELDKGGSKTGSLFNQRISVSVVIRLIMKTHSSSEDITTTSGDSDLTRMAFRKDPLPEGESGRFRGPDPVENDVCAVDIP
jgi:hypothetical protein